MTIRNISSLEELFVSFLLGNKFIQATSLFLLNSFFLVNKTCDSAVGLSVFLVQ